MEKTEKTKYEAMTEQQLRELIHSPSLPLEELEKVVAELKARQAKEQTLINTITESLKKSLASMKPLPDRKFLIDITNNEIKVEPYTTPTIAPTVVTPLPQRGGRVRLVFSNEVKEFTSGNQALKFLSQLLWEKGVQDFTIHSQLLKHQNALSQLKREKFQDWLKSLIPDLTKIEVIS